MEKFTLKTRNVSDPDNHPEMRPTENEFVDDILKYINEVQTYVGEVKF